MSNYKSNPLLDSFNTPSDNTSNASRNKSQAVNIVSNFMSQQPNRQSEDTDFAKIQAIYNNYQKQVIPTTPNTPPKNTPPKKPWFNFGKQKPHTEENKIDKIATPATIRKKSWKNRLTWLLGFALIIGGISWYLVVIQPTGLEVIYSTNQSKINNLNSDFKNTSTELLNYTKELDKFTNTSVSSNCLTQSMIKDESVSQSSMDDFLNNKLTYNPDQNQITKDSNVLTYKYFDNNYGNIKLSYSDSLKILKQNLDSISYIPELVKYKNKFIEGCQILANKGFNIETINQFCDELVPQKNSIIQYFSTLEIPANSKLSTSIAKSIQGCNAKPKLGTNGRIARDSVTIAVWEEQFNLDYDEFLGRRIQVDTILKEIQATDIQFDEEITKVRQSNQKEYDRKKSGFPNFYILQPDTKAIAKRLPI